MKNISSTLDILLHAKEEDIKKVKPASRRKILRRRRLEGEVK